MSAAPRNTTETKPLKRGKACLTCRFLKIKCDGAKPICGPCLRHPKDDECEYADSPRRSRTKQLEDQVARLEARLRDLEQPEAPTPIVLRNPYEDPSQALTPNTAFGPSTSDVTWVPSMSSPFSSLLSPAGPISPSGTPDSLGRHSTSTCSDEPPSAIARSFLDTFFKYAPELGFFLYSPNFYSSSTRTPRFGDPERPCPSVLTAIYLWGHTLARTADSQRSGSRREYLDAALKHAALGLSSNHPDKYIHTIQAEVLLSNYFLRVGNLLEARVHAGTALSISLGCGLHRIRSDRGYPAALLYSSGDEATVGRLPPPNNAVEEGERIDGFWQVVVLCRTLAVALDSPSEVCGHLDARGFQIDTPWPLDKKQYEMNVLPQPSVNTGNAFLRQGSPVDVSGSLLALTAQSAILLQEATFFSGQWIGGHNPQNFAQTYQILSRLLSQLSHQLPPLQPHKKPAFFVHALVYAATIKLNEVPASSEFRARQDCVAAAHSMIHWGNNILDDRVCTNPITGTLLSFAIQALIEEILRLRAGHPLLEDTKDFTVEGIEDTLRIGFQLLYMFSEEIQFMKYRLTNMQETYNTSLMHRAVA